MDSLLAGGGAAGIIIACVYVGRLMLDAFRDWRSGDVAVKTGAMTDANTANAVILSSLTALSLENGRLQRKIAHLEDEADESRRLATEKDRKIKRLEDRLGTAQAQIQTIADELQALRRRDTTPPR
jgi:chromosome segregation ATPase